MIYLDTNILLYATLTKVDTPSQQDRAIEILKELIDNETLLLSNLNLLEKKKRDFLMS
jgi:predicted nucleic acid-binding protein